MENTQQILNIDQASLDLLAKEFPDNLIQVDHSQPGFSPRYINWTSVVQRLDDAFKGGWSFTVIKWESWPTHVVVHGRLTVRVVHTIGGVDHVVEIAKDGIGSSRWSVDPGSGQYADQTYDLKAAASDALKRAALLFRVGLHLYDKKSNEEYARQQVMSQQQANLNETAQPFQIKAVVEFFECKLGVNRMDWMAHLQLQDINAMTQRQAAEVLSGTHPYVQELCRARGVAVQPAGVSRA